MSTLSDNILFYSPVLKKNVLGITFKRPQPVLKTIRTFCPRSGCTEHSLTTTYHPKRKRFLDVNRSICSKGHVEISFQSHINPALLK